MTAPHRTAYPHFPQRFADHDLPVASTPTDDAVAFARRDARLPQHQFRLRGLRKVFQNLGYFPPLATIPPVVIAPIRQTADGADDVPFAGVADRTIRHQHQLVRT
ncbi:MAG: hypothetical protein MI924_03415 [Chloroflexales bacterium]|nr:hypothetical protein [Chloroflexales bacterium]